MIPRIEILENWILENWILFLIDWTLTSAVFKLYLLGRCDDLIAEFIIDSLLGLIWLENFVLVLLVVVLIWDECVEVEIGDDGIGRLQKSNVKS